MGPAKNDLRRGFTAKLIGKLKPNFIGRRLSMVDRITENYEYQFMILFTFPMQPYDVETKCHDYSSKDTDQGF